MLINAYQNSPFQTLSHRYLGSLKPCGHPLSLNKPFFHESNNITSLHFELNVELVLVLSAFHRDDVCRGRALRNRLGLCQRRLGFGHVERNEDDIDEEDEEEQEEEVGHAHSLLVFAVAASEVGDGGEGEEGDDQVPEPVGGHEEGVGLGSDSEGSDLKREEDEDERRKGRGRANLAHDDPGDRARTQAKADHVEDDGHHTQVPVPLEQEGCAEQG